MIGTTAFSIDAKTTEAGVTVIAVTGDLDLFVASRLRETLLGALAGGRPPYILIDLSGLVFTDSTGLGLIIAGHKRAKARGGMLALAAVPPNTASLLRIAGLEKLLRAYPTIAEGVAGLTAGCAA